MAAPVTLSTALLPGTPQSSPSHAGQHNEIARRLPVVAPGAPTGSDATDTANVGDALGVLGQYGILFLTAGVFLINATRSSSLDNIKITGPGILKVADGSNITYILNLSGSNVRVEGVRFDGNKANTTGANSGIHWADGATDVESVLCEFRNFDGAPIRANENNSGTCARVHTRWCFFDANGYWAIHYEGTCPNSAVVGNVIRNGYGIKIDRSLRLRVSHNDIADITGIGIEIWTNCHRSLVQFNLIVNAATGNQPAVLGAGTSIGMGVSTAASDYCTISTNYAENVDFAGYEFAGSRWYKCVNNTADNVNHVSDGGGVTASTDANGPTHGLIEGCHLFNCSWKAIFLHSGFSYTKILNCFILDCEAGIFLRNSGSNVTNCLIQSCWVHNCQQEGLEIEANNTELQVLDSDFRGNNQATGTANVVDAGTRTIFRNNRGTYLGNEIYIPWEKFHTNGSTAPSGPEAIGSSSGNRTYGWGFDVAADSVISAEQAVPLWWQGLTCNVYFDWSPRAAGSSGNLIRWLTNAVAIAEGAEVDAAFPSGVSGDFSANVAIDIRTISGPLAVTIPTLPFDGRLRWRAYRVAPLGANDFNAKADFAGLILRIADP